jgi:hypothetical protein
VIELGGINPAAFQTDCARLVLTPMKFGTMQPVTGIGVAVGSGVGVGDGVGAGVGLGAGVGVGVGVGVGGGSLLRGCG